MVSSLALVLAALAPASAGAAAHGEAHSTVMFSCKAVTFNFEGFPNKPNNKVSETIHIDVHTYRSLTYTFSGPTGSNTVEIDLPPGHHKIDAQTKWNTNGVKGGQDVPKNHGITCGPEPAFEVQKLQKIGSSGTYTKATLTSGHPGQTVYYEFIVTNTGNVPLTFSNFTDPHCDSGTVSGGPGSSPVAAGASTTYYCDHVLTKADQSARSYDNTASVTGTDESGTAVTNQSNTVVVEVPNPMNGATITCKSVTFTFEGFPNLPNNTVTEIIHADGKLIYSGKFTFSGPSGSNTVTINLPPGHHKVDARTEWNTNGVKGGRDILKHNGITCSSTEASLTIEKLQKVGSSGSFTKSEVSAKEGEIVFYEIIVTNTGVVPLNLSNFSDENCMNVAGGKPTLAPKESATWTCEHILAATGKYSNAASVEANEGLGKEQSNTVSVNVTGGKAGLTIEKLQKIGSSGFTTEEVTAKTGETVEYEIIVKNIGEATLTLSNFTDEGCTKIEGGKGTLAPEESTTWTCEHKLTGAGKYTNAATVEANEGVGKRESNKVTVNVELPKVGACAPSSSLAALIFGKNVISYFPLGAWDNTATTGIAVVDVEGSATKQTVIPTKSAVNSCASNPQTGVTVCTANTNEVYVVKETSVVATLTDSGSGAIGFSGGGCTTCGVAMDAVHDRALLTISIEGTHAFQFLNLETMSFEKPFAAASGNVSENPLIDPTRELILSATESSVYEIVNVAKAGAFEAFDNTEFSAEYDSTGEDCSTGIALASAEFVEPTELLIGDLTQAKYASGSPGTWSAPAHLVTLEESFLAAGSTGLAVAQGTHTGVATGEFGGEELTALALPETSGSGTPNLRDYVSCGIGHGWDQGDDPHVVTAYQSPNGGDAIALFGNKAATEIAAVDLTKLLNPAIVPRTPGGHACQSATLPEEVVSFRQVTKPPQFIEDSPPAEATEGSFYSYTFSASGNPAPEYTLASGSLPKGLSLNSASGQLSGEPTEAGTFEFTVKASNGVEPPAVTPTLTITVSPKMAPKFTEDSPPESATVGEEYFYTFAAEGHPAPTFTVSSGTLPPGLFLFPEGELNGFPEEAGTFEFTVEASNGVPPEAFTPTLKIVVAP